MVSDSTIFIMERQSETNLEKVIFIKLIKEGNEFLINSSIWNGFQKMSVCILVMIGDILFV